MDSIEEGDFVIRIRPSEIDGEWTGEIDISIISQADNPLNDEGYTQLMHFCKMMCASVPLMEADDSLRNLVHSYVMETIDKDDEDVIDDDSSIVITKEDGNVVHLSFGSRTKGNA
jgi:hypothetical protein|tara:strand:- start:25 stop:369 length:345 start_codon:yes stop_codon:yes gene_type:complete